MTEETRDAAERTGRERRMLERLTGVPPRDRAFSTRYSLFVRWMRLLLPLAAVAIIAVLFTWPTVTEEDIGTMTGRVEDLKAAATNELVRPRFESTDKKKQPYTITAQRAVQSKEDDNLILLEKPVGDMTLNSGNWIAIEAERGAYRRDLQLLVLDGHVRLFHDRGYRLETARLQIDLDKSTARSEDEVYGQGPAGTLQARGLEADNINGRLVFTGPARLVLNRSLKGLN